MLIVAGSLHKPTRFPHNKFRSIFHSRVPPRRAIQNGLINDGVIVIERIVLLFVRFGSLLVKGVPPFSKHFIERHELANNVHWLTWAYFYTLLISSTFALDTHVYS